MTTLDEVLQKYKTDPAYGQEYIIPSTKVSGVTESKKPILSQAALDKRAYLAGNPTTAQQKLQASMPWESMRASSTGLNAWNEQGKLYGPDNPSTARGENRDDILTQKLNAALMAQQETDNPELMVQRQHPDLPYKNNLLPFERFKNARTDEDFTNLVSRRKAQGQFEEDEFIRNELVRKLTAESQGQEFVPEQYVSQEKPFDRNAHKAYPGEISYEGNRRKMWQDIHPLDAETIYSGETSEKKSFTGDNLQSEHVISMGRIRKNMNAQAATKGIAPRTRQQWRETSERANELEGVGFNLRPVRAGTNKNRGHKRQGEIEGGQAYDQAGNLKIDSKNQIWEPKDKTKGEVARISLGMQALFPDEVNLSSKEIKQYKNWSKEHPPTKEEKLLNMVHKHIYGQGNPVIEELSERDTKNQLQNPQNKIAAGLGYHITEGMLGDKAYGEIAPLDYRTQNAQRNTRRADALAEKNSLGSNLKNKALYGFSTGIGLASGGANALLRGAELLTDDPETLKGLRTGREFFNMVDDEVGKWVDRSNVQGALANIDPELTEATKSFTDAQAALEKGDNIAAAKHIVGTLVSFGGAVAKFARDDPDAIGDVLAESLPQMIAAAIAPIGGTVIITARYFNENVEAFKKEHGGREPTTSEYVELFTVSAASAASESASAVFALKPILGKLGIARKTGKAAVKNAGVTARKTAANVKATVGQGKAAMAKGALLGAGKMAAGTVGLTAKGAAKILTSLPVKRGAQSLVVEGAQEAFQTATEEYSKYLDVAKMDPKTIITGGVLGAAAGGSIGVTGGVVEGARRAAGGSINTAIKSAATARDKAMGGSKQFTNDIASKRDPVKAFDVERSNFQRAQSQQEAFEVINRLEEHRNNLENNLNKYLADNQQKVLTKGSAEEQTALDMQTSVQHMEDDIAAKTTAAKYKLNPTEAAGLDQAYANLANPDTEYKSEDIAKVAENIIFGSEQYEGSPEAIEKILKNSTLPTDVRRFLDAALAASKTLKLYDSKDINKGDNDFRATHNEISDESRGGARFYARQLSNAVARRDQKAFVNILKRLDKFTGIQNSKIGAFEEKIAEAKNKNQRIKQLKENDAPQSEIDAISAKNNPIDVLWGTVANEKKPFVIKAQERAGDDLDLYELKGPNIPYEQAQIEADVLNKISNLFHNMPNEILGKKKRKETYAYRTDGKTDAEAKQEKEDDSGMEGESSDEDTSQSTKEEEGVDDDMEGETSDEDDTQSTEEEDEDGMEGESSNEDDTPPWEEGEEEGSMEGEASEDEGTDEGTNDESDMEGETSDDEDMEGEAADDAVDSSQFGSEATPEPTSFTDDFGSEATGTSPDYSEDTDGAAELARLPVYLRGQKTMIYAGVGSSDIDTLNSTHRDNVKLIAEDLAAVDRPSGRYFLNTGDAAGADAAFHAGARSVLGGTAKFDVSDADERTRKIAKFMYPNENLSGRTLDLMARNVKQVFGENLDSPVDFVLVWTRKNPKGVAPQTIEEVHYSPGSEFHTGGTAMAIAVANMKGIPVINMNQDDPKVWVARLNKAIAGKLGGTDRSRAAGPKTGSNEEEEKENQQKRASGKAFVAENPELDYAATTYSIFRTKGYKSTAANEAKSALDIKVNDFVEQMKKNKTNSVNGVPFSKFINRLLFDFYNTYGWPTTRETIINTAHGKPRGYKEGKTTFDELFQAKSSKPSSLLATIPDFIEVSGMSNEAIPIINERQKIEEKESGDTEPAYKLLWKYYDIFKENLDDLYHNDTAGSLQIPVTDDSSHGLLVDQNGNMNPNVITAMVVGSMDWLARAANTSLAREERHVTDFLGLPDKYYLGRYDKKTIQNLRQSGVLREQVADDIGGAILKQLNIAARHDTDITELAHLRSSLGLLAIASMQKAGLIENTRIKKIEFVKLDSTLKSNGTIDLSKGQGLISKKFYGTRKQSSVFVRATTQKKKNGITAKTRDGRVWLNNEMKNLVKDVIAYAPVYDKLFGMKIDDAVPMDEPITEVDTHYKGTGTNMSAFTEAAVDHMQQVPWHIRSNALEQLKRFPDIKMVPDDNDVMVRQGIDYRLKIFGFVDPAEKHATETDGIEAKNAGLVRHWQDFNEYLDNRGDRNAAMYFKYFGVVNNRLHVSNPIVNYQSSKTVRWLIAAEAGIANLDVSNYVGNNNDALQEHKIAIVEAFGYSAKNTTRKEQLEVFHKDFISEAGILRPKYRKAVTILNSKSKKLSNLQAKTIYEAVDSGREDVHSFAGLHAIAELIAGIESRNKSLEISLAREIDGTTNGVISALLQLVSDNTQGITNAGGMFYKGDEEVDYAEYIKDNHDNYQKVAVEVYAARESFVQANADKKGKNKVKGLPYNPYYVTEQEAVFSTLGDMGTVFEGALTEISSSWRELHKDPLMTLVYGAEINKILSNFKELALKRFYADLVKNHKDKKALTAMFQNLENMGMGFLWTRYDKKLRTGSGKPKGFSKEVDRIYMNLENARDWKFHPWERVQFMQKMDTYYTAPLQKALKEHLGDFIAKRSGINNAGDFMNRVFMGFWTVEKARIRAEHARNYSEEERVAFYKKMQKRGLIPGVESITSNPDKNDYQDYIQTTNTEKISMIGQKNGEVRLHYKEGKGTSVTDLTSEESADQQTLKTHSVVRDYTYNIGSKFFPLLNQPMDSAVIQNPLGNSDFANLYDALIAGSGTARSIATAMNESFLTQHESWSMAKVVKDSMGRFIEAYSELPTAEKKIVVYGNKDTKGKELKPLLKYNTWGDVVSNVTLFDQELGLGESVSIVKSKALTEFPKALKNEFMPLLEEWHIAKEENFDTLANSQQYPNYGSAATVKNNDVAPKQDGKSWDELGSEDFDSNRNFEPKNPSTELNSTVARETFGKLKNIGNIHDSMEHQTYLEDTLNNSILPVMATMDAFTLHLGTTKTGERHVGSIKGQNIYIGANEGIQNTSSNPSPQEIYVHEMFHAVLRWGIDNTPKMRNEVRRLFEIAEQDPNLDYKAFLRKDADPNDTAEITEAKRKYDYVFKNGGPGYLHEFASFGLSNEAFMTALHNLDVTKKRTIFEGTIPERIAAVFGFISDRISSMVRGGAPKNARDALIKLAQNINGINNQSLNKFDQYWNKTWGAVNTVAGKGLRNYMLKPYIKSVVKLQQGRQKRRAEGQNANRLVDRYLITPYILPKEIIYDNFLGTLSEVAYDMGLTMDNVAHHFLTEVRGPTTISKKYHKLLREGKHAIDSAVERKSGSISDVITEAFGRALTSQEWLDLNTVILKGDLSVLTKVYSMQHIRNMLAAPGGLNTEISKLKAQIRKMAPTNGEFYINQAKSLGGFMAIGKDGVGMTMHNAHTIVKMKHLERFGYTPENADTTMVEEYVDQLATLHAMKSTPKAAKQNTVKIIDEEFRRGVETNGIDLLMLMQNRFKEDALKMLFNGNKTLMMKGWTREMYDEYKSFRVGTKAQQIEFAEQGFVLQEEILGDKHYNKIPKQYMYVSKDGLMNRRVTGNMGLTNKIGKGHDMLSLAYQEIAATPGKGSRNPNKLATKNHADYENKMLSNLTAQFAGELDMDYDNNWLVPLLKGSGQIHTYRYTMSEQTKIQALGKRDKANAVMGRMYGSLIAKPATTKQNTSVLEYAFQDWQKHYADDPRAFIHISSEMPTGLTKRQQKKRKKAQDLFHLVPSDTKLEMQRIWGNDVEEGFYIREDLMYLIGGFRKASFTDWLDQNTGEIMPHQMKHIMRLSGIFWEAVVATGKRNIILFLPQIITDNTYSNTHFLMMRGVPPTYAMKKEAEAVGLLMGYLKDSKERGRLTSLIAADPKHSRTQSRRLRLERLRKNMEKNPVSKLIDAGLFQSLSEDLSTSSTEEYENRIKKAVSNAIPVMGEILEGLENRIPKTWQDAYNFAVFDPKDPMAQAITKATQFSDFAARYALYSWRTEQQKDNIPEGVTEAQWAELAIEEAQDVFVNYDDPTSPEMQWLNDMGVIMFTKYMFRMMRVVARPFTAAGRIEELRRQADEQIAENNKEKQAKIAMEGETVGNALGMNFLEDVFIGGADIMDNSLLFSKNITDNMFGPWDHLMNAVTPNSVRWAGGLFDMMPGAGE